MTPLSPDFFARPTLEVARDLLGALLVHETPSGRLAGRLVETEAYTQDDPAFHGWGLVDPATGLLRPEGRAYDLFGAPGTAYVYLNYGVHWLLNVVTEPEGVGGAVLLRGVEPLEGLDVLRAHRPGIGRVRDLTNGPGKLARAFAVDGRMHGRRLTAPPLYLAAGRPVPAAALGTSTRIGLTRGADRPWRFFEVGNPFVSPGVPSDVALARRARRR